MNVELENLNNGEVLLRIELPAERVEAEWKKVVGLFAQQAKIPGFRPGKAPRAIVESKYGEEIRGELTQRLTQEALREAIKAKDLRVLGIRRVQDAEVGMDRVFRCQATCIVEPEFTLPDYKQITVAVAPVEVNEERLNETMDSLREAHASYHPVEGRALAEGDFAVISYEGSLDGQPLKDLVPEAPPLVLGRQSMWIEVKGDQFLPGFLPALHGQKIGETRQVSVTLPEAYQIEALKGKTLDYQVTLDAINERVLPEFTDELAAQILPGKTLAELREQVRARMEAQTKQYNESQKQQAVLKSLLGACDFTPPEAMVAQATGQTLRDIIRDNQARGVSDEQLKEHTEQIVAMAQLAATDRVKARFILARIAQEEKIAVTEAEMLKALAQMSNELDIPPKKLLKDLQKNDTVRDIHQEILVRKALDFVCQQATVTAPAAA